MFGCEPPESRNTQTNTKELPQPIHNYKLELKENEIYINFATDKYEEYIITKDTITNIVYIQQRNSVFPRIAIIPNGTKYEND
jgi:hypothetical protein